MKDCNIIIVILIVILFILYTFAPIYNNNKNNDGEGFSQLGNIRKCCSVCMSSLKNQENNTVLYYNKFRQLQMELAMCQAKLIDTQDILDNYKTKLIMCTRNTAKDKKPVIAKYHGHYGLAPNSITGVGVETNTKY